MTDEENLKGSLWFCELYKLTFCLGNKFILLQFKKYSLMKDKKTINLMIDKLFSKNTEEVLLTIGQIRDNGDVSIIPHTIELLNNKPGTEIEKALISLLNDLKIQGSAEEIVKAIGNKKYTSIHKQLLVSCWESGLNYSEHLEFFVDLFIAGNFDIAFEAFTVIENMEQKISNDIIIPFIDKLKKSTSSIAREKSELLIELVHILEELSEPAQNLN